MTVRVDDAKNRRAKSHANLERIEWHRASQFPPTPKQRRYGENPNETNNYSSREKRPFGLVHSLHLDAVMKFDALRPIGGEINPVSCIAKTAGQRGRDEGDAKGEITNVIEYILR